MRSGFSQVLKINSLLIEEVRIPVNKGRSNHIADLLLGLQRLYTMPDLSIKVEEILRQTVGTKRSSGKGSTGMSLWEILVLSQLRLCLNISYDEVMDLANHHYLVRGILGLEVTHGEHNRKQYSKSTIYDNLILLSDESLEQINAVVIELGHRVFKHNKKKDQALSLKTDSFVVESDTYFPTDYRHLYESGRKCNELIGKLSNQLAISGWRQWKDNIKKLKSAYRDFGRITSSGGQNKQERQRQACNKLLEEGRKLSVKIINFKALAYHQCDEVNFPCLVQVEWFHRMLEKHIDLLDRRILQGESIPHQEKIFSIFQPYVEWINKGKRDVEIGKKLFVTTDQYDLILHYTIGYKQQDEAAFCAIVDQVKATYELINSWSVDKGFSSKENKALINVVYPDINLIMSKKGKRNKDETAQETDKKFVKLRHKHNAIESNINELEHRGLNRCMDRSKVAFNKYVGLAVIAYNLHKIGRKLSKEMAIAKAREKEIKLLLAA